MAAKTRSGLSFSGRKIRPQKGLGRARLGGRSSPTLRKGAVAHGPKATLRRLKMNRKARLLSKFSCLNAVRNRVSWVESFPLSSSKAKDFAPFCSLGRTLLIAERPVDLRAVRNLRDLKVLPYYALNVRDLLHSKRVIVDRRSVEIYQDLMATREVDEGLQL